MESYAYAYSYPEPRDSPPRSQEVDFDSNPTPSWEDQPPPTHKVKFMVSYNGKIQPRSHDNLLSYVGGETKFLAVDRSVKFNLLLSKLSSLIADDPSVNIASFKYQLPGEDLDALISVTNNDDLEHMMHEYDRLYRASAKPNRLRLFAFPGQSSGLGSERFVDALNSSSVPDLRQGNGNNVNFLFGLDNKVPVHHPDRITDPRIQQLNRLQISVQELPRSDDNLNARDAYQKPPPTNPASVQIYFFKPLTPDFLFNFSIPKSFLKHIGGRSEYDGLKEKIVILRDKKKLNWYVKMIGREFKDGWEKFCAYNKMQIGDFVVLKHQGQLIFDVYIFEPSCCERQNIHPMAASTSTLHHSTTPPKLIKALKEKKRKYERIEKEWFKPSGNPYWQTIIQPSYFGWGGLSIPKAFAMQNGLAKRWCQLVLLDAEGNQPCPLTLRYRKRKTCNGSGGAPYIGGWAQFHKLLDLKVGDVLTFELLDNGEVPVIKFHRGETTDIHP